MIPGDFICINQLDAGDIGQVIQCGRKGLCRKIEGIGDVILRIGRIRP